MQILTVAAAGNAEQGKNLINARFMAEALRQLRGYDVGVLDNSFYSATYPSGKSRTSNANKMWKITTSISGDIAIGPGMATAYGYDIQSEGTIHLNAGSAIAGQYIFVYLEWNLSNPDLAVGKIDLYNNGTAASWTPSPQDNLINNPAGIYRLPLYRLYKNSNGTFSSVKWDSLGVITIVNTLRAKYADNADVAQKAKDYDTSNGTIKTKFDSVEQRLTNLGFRSGSLTLSSTLTSRGTATQNSVVRQGNYCIVNLQISLTQVKSTFAAGELIATVPSNFRAARVQRFTGFIRGKGSDVGYSDYTRYFVVFKIDGVDISIDSFNWSEKHESHYADKENGIIALLGGGYEAAPIN